MPEDLPTCGECGGLLFGVEVTAEGDRRGVPCGCELA